MNTNRIIDIDTLQYGDIAELKSGYVVEYLGEFYSFILDYKYKVKKKWLYFIASNGVLTTKSKLKVVNIQKKGNISRRQAEKKINDYIQKRAMFDSQFLCFGATYEKKKHVQEQVNTYSILNNSISYDLSKDAKPYDHTKINYDINNFLKRLFYGENGCFLLEKYSEQTKKLDDENWKDWVLKRQINYRQMERIYKKILNEKDIENVITN